MPIGYTECPYCFNETEIDYEGEEEAELFKETCKNCNHIFDVYFQMSIDFYPSVLNLEKENNGKM